MGDMDLFSYESAKPSSGAEEWRAIPGYEGLYEASSHGRVRSLPRATTSGKILRFNRVKACLVVCLCKNNVKRSIAVHKLVMWAFVGPMPADKHLVAHWDGNFRNNRLTNLRYATYEENEEDKRRHGREAKGERNPSCKLSEGDVIAIRESCRAGESVADLSVRFGMCKSQIYNIIRGHCWSDNGNAARRMERAKRKRAALVRDSGRRREDPETGRMAIVWRLA